MDDRNERVAESIVELLPAVAVNLRLSALFDVGVAHLTPSQLISLFLVDAAEDGRLRAGQIARELAVTMPAATAMVNRLVSAGLFERNRGADRRVVWVSLTERGGLLMDALRRGLVERISTIMGAMDGIAQDALVEALHRVASFAHEMATSGSTRDHGASA